MSLRLRLSLTLGAAFALIWALAAAWMLSDLRNQMMFSLDVILRGCNSLSCTPNSCSVAK